MVTTPHDPFQPPKAQLEVPVDRGPRPKQVKLAAILVAVGAVLSFLSSLAVFSGVAALPALPQPHIGDLLSAAFSLALMLFLAWKIHAGMNWARWVFTVLVVIGVVGLTVSFFVASHVMKAMPAYLWVVSSAQTAIQLVAVLLMFGKIASPWFRNKG